MPRRLKFDCRLPVSVKDTGRTVVLPCRPVFAHGRNYLQTGFLSGAFL
jgi:hypothetical protein